MAIDRRPEQRVAGDRHALVYFVSVVVGLGSSGRADFQNWRPVTASSATASSAVPVYMMPSTTSGVFSIFDVIGMVDPLHLQILDVASVDLVSGLNGGFRTLLSK